VNFTPRPGSATDKAIKHLKTVSGPITEAAMAIAIDYPEDEVKGLLNFAVMQGLLAWDIGGSGRMWRLGDRQPGDVPKAEHTGIAKNPLGQLTPAELADLPQAMAAAVAKAAPAPEVAAANVAPPARTYPGSYTPRAGSNAERVMQYLAERAPFGGDVWVVSRTLAQACDMEPAQFHIFMAPALKRGAVRRREGHGDGYLEWQMGNGTPDERVPRANAAAARAPSPAHELAAMVAADEAAVRKAMSVVAAAQPAVDQAAEQSALSRIAARPFVCAAFSDGRLTVQKGVGAVELNRDEALELFEHLSGFLRTPAGGRAR
jgi:hypothetical protein